MHGLPFFESGVGQPSFAKLCKSDSRFRGYRPHFYSRTYPTGQCVHYQGTEITHLGIVTSGILKAVSVSNSGRELCSAYFEEEDTFPEFLFLTGNRCYTYSLYVEKKATVLWIPLEILDEMLTADPQLMSALLFHVSQRGLKNQLYLNCLNYQTIRERIAYWIVGIQKIDPRMSIRMPRSQTIFSNILHVSRSSLNQELRQMEREGYFRIEKGKMQDVDVERLGELL